MKDKEKIRKLATEKAYNECKNFVMIRQNCWDMSPDGKHTEDCFIEELAEKRCLSSHLCPSLYRKFYEYTDCHLWAEFFAHKNDERYLKARERINSDRIMKYMCREIVQDLSKEMSKFSKYRDEVLESASFSNTNV